MFDLSIALFVTGLVLLAFQLGKRSRQENPPSSPVAITNAGGAQVDADAFLSLRESYRKVKSLYKELERTSKRDHALVQLYEAKLPEGEKFHVRLAEKLAEVTGAESVAIYTVSQMRNAMIVRGTTRGASQVVRDASHTISLRNVAKKITDDVELATRAILGSEDRSKIGSILLHSKNRAIGMMSLFHTDWDALCEAKRLSEELAPLVAHLIAEESHRSETDKRSKELGLLYEVAVTTNGATTRREIVERVGRELGSVIEADFVGAYLLEEFCPVLVGGRGIELGFFEGMSFFGGEGYYGWLVSGTPELTIFRPAEDQRCDTAALRRRRVGSFILVPLQFADAPFGFLVAVSHTTEALDSSDLARIRSIAAEVSQTVRRLERPSASPHGLVTPSAFQSLLDQGRGGSIVCLELLKRQHLAEICGPRSIEDALRQFSFRLYGKLPVEGAACRRQGGDYVIYLPGASDAYARSWANDLAATASMIGVRTSGGTQSVPLAFRARVANFDKQSHEVFAINALSG